MRISSGKRLCGIKFDKHQKNMLDDLINEKFEENVYEPFNKTKKSQSHKV